MTCLYFCGIIEQGEGIGEFMYTKDTLCLSCSKSLLGCSWSKDFIPVGGWKAKPTKNRSGYDSFFVQECPLYEYDGLCLRCKNFDSNCENPMNWYKKCKNFRGSQGFGDCSGFVNKYKNQYLED